MGNFGELLMWCIFSKDTKLPFETCMQYVRCIYAPMTLNIQTTKLQYKSLWLSPYMALAIVDYLHGKVYPFHLGALSKPHSLSFIN